MNVLHLGFFELVRAEPLLRSEAQTAARRQAKGTIDWGQVSPIATFPVTKHIKDEFGPAGDSQLLEDTVDVIPEG